jgi:epoxyqueuosine reductase
MSDTLTSTQIKQWARQLGFDLVGIAPAEPIPHADKFKDFLVKGYHGDMHYLGRHVEKRLDPRLLFPGARSIICTALNYFSESENKRVRHLFGRVARYAWIRDYHEIIKTRLYQLADRIIQESEGVVQWRCFVDTAPLAEKAHAARAGLGWIGKNSLLVNEQLGSWLILGEIVTDLELDYDQPVTDLCGSCDRCLTACPTKALVEPRILDARRCISYLTIESKSPIPDELAPGIGNWIFGCDTCQNACPFNQEPKPTNDPDLQPLKKWQKIDLSTILDMDSEQFKELFADSAILRINLEHLRQVASACQKNGF